MTKEQRKEYMRNYREKNKERIKESTLLRARQNFLHSISGDKDAVLKWISEHKVGDGWYPIEGRWRKDGFPVVILHNPKQSFSYCVQCAGNGIYFNTIERARQQVDMILSK